MIKPKKSLGQNFIKDKNICKKIVKLANLKDKTIFEIGPGYGYLTDFIINEKPKKLYLIEKDNSLSLFLNNKYQLINEISVINSDVMDYDFSKFNKIILISNLPYNISSKFILRFLKYNNNISEMILMIQKEVAIKFDYNKEKLNKYKFLIKLCSEYKRCFNVSPSVFFPKPKVVSTIVKFKFNKKSINWNKADNFVSKIFKNKRKKIFNNLLIDKKKGFNLLDKRIDQININELLRIYNFF